MKRFYSIFISSLLLLNIMPNLTLSLTPMARSQTLASDLIQYNAPPEPENGDPGGRGRGGGSRDNCKPYANLTAIVPQGQGDRVWGMTIDSHPAFWFYVPVALNAQRPMKFVLLDQEGNKVYDQTFKPSLTPAGIIHITLPLSSPGLKVNQSYRWGFSIDCDPINQKQPISVRGMIHRTALTPVIEKQLDQTDNALDRAKLYAKNGIWFDALTTLARQSTPWEIPDPKVVEAWSALLKQGNLSDVETGAIVPCCTQIERR
jgi:Domain of Unknown Function (DUF928)